MRFCLCLGVPALGHTQYIFPSLSLGTFTLSISGLPFGYNSRRVYLINTIQHVCQVLQQNKRPSKGLKLHILFLVKYIVDISYLTIYRMVLSFHSQI